MVVDGKSLSNSEEVGIAGLRGSTSLLAGSITLVTGCGVELLLKREAVNCKRGAEGELDGCSVGVLIGQLGVICGSNDAGMTAHLFSSFETADRVLQGGRPASS